LEGEQTALASARDAATRQLQGCQDELAQFQAKLKDSDSSFESLVASHAQSASEAMAQLAAMEAAKASCESRFHELTAHAIALDEHHAQFKSAALERETSLQSQVVSHRVDLSAMTSCAALLESVVSAAGDAAQALSAVHCASSAEAQSSLSEALRLACVADQQRAALESALRAFQVRMQVRVRE
jgi:hypothetical protein